MGFESRHVPDHSLLKCSIQLICYENGNQNNVLDMSTIPQGFGEDICLFIFFYFVFLFFFYFIYLFFFFFVITQ